MFATVLVPQTYLPPDGTDRSVNGPPTACAFLPDGLSAKCFWVYVLLKRLLLVTLARFSVPLITGLLSAHGPGTRRHLIGSTEAAAGRENNVKLVSPKSTASVLHFKAKHPTNVY